MSKILQILYTRNSLNFAVWKFAALILAILIVVPTLGLATINPQMVSEMRVEVKQDVLLSLSGKVKTLEVSLMIPQEEAFQEIESIQVSEPYETVTDEYGNKMIKITFEDPDASVSFNAKSIVKISRRTSASPPQLSIFTEPTTLIESGDAQIIKLTEEVVAGEKDAFGKAALVAEWVNENIEYDLAYAEVNLSAKKTLEKKAGVCDEYSALTMAMLRGMGYRTAYIVGYAYGRGYRIAEDFVPHGWVEACSSDGRCFPIDSTWGEAGWLDASHIKFATLPESHYVEATASATGQDEIAVKLETVETKIRILDSKEQPLIRTELSLLDEKVWDGYAVTKTELNAPGCVFTKVRQGSCLRETGPFLEPEENESAVYFCGKRTLFMPFKIPDDLESGMIYTCALTSMPGAGEQKAVEVTLDPRERSREAPVLSLDRTTVKAGETVTASAPQAEIFTDYGAYGEDQVSLVAPAKDFRIYAYREGQMVFQDITVAETRPIDIKLSVPENVTAGEEANLSVEIKNIGATSRAVSVRFEDQTRSSRIGAGKSKIFIFGFVPAESDRFVQVFVESEGFATSSSAPINVIAPEKNILEQIIKAIQNFFRSIFGG